MAVQSMLEQKRRFQLMNSENYREMTGLMGQLLKAAYIEMHGGEKKVET